MYEETIRTYGSQGDVRSLIRLSVGLIAHGHSIKLAAAARFETLVEGFGIAFVHLIGDPATFRGLGDSGNSFLMMIRYLMNHAVEIGTGVL